MECSDEFCEPGKGRGADVFVFCNLMIWVQNFMVNEIEILRSVQLRRESHHYKSSASHRREGGIFGWRSLSSSQSSITSQPLTHFLSSVLVGAVSEPQQFVVIVLYVFAV